MREICWKPQTFPFWILPLPLVFQAWDILRKCLKNNTRSPLPITEENGISILIPLMKSTIIINKNAPQGYATFEVLFYYTSLWFKMMKTIIFPIL